MIESSLKLSERSIQDSIYNPLHDLGYRYICPNYTPVNWFECDVFAVTKSGYWVEFEIKLTVADFRADAKKEKYRYIRPLDAKPLSDWKVEKHVKHELLTARSEHAPSRFYYVTPVGMVQPEQLPQWAGLFEANISGRNIHIYRKKAAPKINYAPVPQNILTHVQGIFYWRYWNLRHSRAAKNLLTSPAIAETSAPN